ncbi:alpha/beta hydrolase [Micromonospora sp. M12]
MTVVGHSYGSTVLGEAASTGNGLAADDLIAVGSPGCASTAPASSTLIRVTCGMVPPAMTRSLLGLKRTRAG